MAWSWSSTGSLSSTRRNSGAFWTSISDAVYGGWYNASSVALNTSEEFNWSTRSAWWTSSRNLPAESGWAWGSWTAGILAAGYTGWAKYTSDEYDWTTWSAWWDTAYYHWNLAWWGTQTDWALFGWYDGWAPSNRTEEYNWTSFSAWWALNTSANWNWWDWTSGSNLLYTFSNVSEEYNWTSWSYWWAPSVSRNNSSCIWNSWAAIAFWNASFSNVTEEYDWISWSAWWNMITAFQIPWWRAWVKWSWLRAWWYVSNATVGCEIYTIAAATAIKTILWLARASIKTVNWLAIASVKTWEWLV